MGEVTDYKGLLEENHRLKANIKQLQDQLFTLSEEKFNTQIKGNEDSYKLLFENAPLPYQSLDENGNIIIVNNAWLSMLCYEKKEVIGTFIGNYLTKDSLNLLQQRFPLFKERGFVQDAEFEFITKKGEKKIVLVNGRIQNDESGNFKATHCILPDITEKIKQEESIRLLLELAPDAFFRGNNKGDIIWVNNKAIELTGYSKTELLSKNLSDLFLKEVLTTKPLNYEALKKGHTIKAERTILKKDGTLVPIEMSSKQMPDGTYQSFIRDITERKQAEEALENMKILLEEAFEQSPVPMVLVSMPDAVIRFANTASIEFLGVQDEGSFINMSLADIKPTWYDIDKQGNPGKLEELPLWKALTGIKTTNEERTIVRKDGTLRRELVHGVPIFNTKGEVIAAYLIMIDITNLKKVEDALTLAEKTAEESEQKFKIISDNIPNANIYQVITKPNGEMQFTYYSAGVKDAYGYTVDEILKDASLLFNMVIEEDRLEFNKAIEKSLKELCPFNHSLRIKKANGELRWHQHIANLRITNNNIIICDGIDIDITEEKRTEQSLLESTNRNRALLDAIPDLMFVFNSEGRIIDYSAENRKSLYITPEIFLGKIITEIMPANIGTITIEKITEALTSNTTCLSNYELEIHGELRLFEGRYVPCGQNQVLAIVRDITEQKNAEKELVKAKEKAEESDRLKSAFLANLSHEIRTPMNAILGFTDLLREPTIQQERNNNFISIIHKSGNHLLSIINDIIEISKIETGQITPHISNVNVFACVEGIFEALKITIPKNKDIQFAFKEPHLTKDTIIKTDEIKLAQILSNLINNAIKYTEKGLVTIEYSIIKDNLLEFKVVDTGIGIDKKYHQLIFNRFNRLESDLATKAGGSGLGLAIAKAYADMLDGSLTVESATGKGSVFTFTIPYNVVKKIKTSDAIMHKDHFPYAKSELILIAEDDEYNFQYITAVLAGSNYKLLRAENGQEAIDFVTKEPISLVLMDIKMPVLNGFDALKEIRNIKPNLKVIAQTAYVLSDDVNQIKKAGFDGYISKPIKKELLFELIQRML